MEDHPSFFISTRRKFDEWVEAELQLSGDKKAADLIRKVVTNRFEDDFKNIAASGATFCDTFNAHTADADEDVAPAGLAEDYQVFRQCLREVPVPVSETRDTNFEAAPGDEQGETREKVYKQVMSARKKDIQFIATNMLTTVDFWKKGGKATTIFQRSKFVQAAAAGEAGKQNAAIIMSAELFPSREIFQIATPHKDQVPLTEGLKSAAKWAMAAQGNNTVCILTDGRSKKVRRFFEDLVDETQTDEQKHLDGCILYGAPLRADIRFPQRKTFGALSNFEKVMGVLPVPKVRMTSKGRSHFSACGEKSTHASSYTNVPIREFGRITRLSLLDKEAIIGAKLPTYFESVIAAAGTKGHPLFWGEVKDVEVFVALFQDLNLSHVFDVSPGSAAASIAAGICGIGYEGLAINALHANWLNRIIDQAMFAIIADRTDDESKELRADLATYFGPSIEEARELLASGEQVDDDVDIDGDDDSN